MLPIINEVIENIKNILPRMRQRLNTVPLRAIHSEGVVGFKKVIKYPAKNPLSVYLLSDFFNLESDFSGIPESLLNSIKTIPEIIQNNPSKWGCLLNTLNMPKLIIII